MSSDGLFDLATRERARRCRQLAIEAEVTAKHFVDPQVSESYRRIAARWLELAADAEAEAVAEETGAQRAKTSG
jgi:hypothetical protein